MPTTPKSKPVIVPENQQDVVVSSEPTDLAALQSKLAQLKQESAELQAQADAAKPADPVESTPLPQDRLASELTDNEVARAEVLRDPFDSSNALKILRNPPGKMLRWISAHYREMRSMRGWVPVLHDDAIGRELSRYIDEPPPRMQGSAEMDNVVRRGDSILAWIDRGIWAKRQLKREQLANRRITSLTKQEPEQYGQHGSTVGHGLSRDANPYQEVRKAPHFVMPDEKAYRSRAKGNVDSPSIKTPGQSFFEDPPDSE